MGICGISEASIGVPCMAEGRGWDIFLPRDSPPSWWLWLFPGLGNTISLWPGLPWIAPCFPPQGKHIPLLCPDPVRCSEPKPLEFSMQHLSRSFCSTRSAHSITPSPILPSPPRHIPAAHSLSISRAREQLQPVRPGTWRGISWNPVSSAGSRNLRAPCEIKLCAHICKCWGRG